jgi:hypothetical protein
MEIKVSDVSSDGILQVVVTYGSIVMGFDSSSRLVGIGLNTPDNAALQCVTKADTFRLERGTSGSPYALNRNQKRREKRAALPKKKRVFVKKPASELLGASVAERVRVGHSYAQIARDIGCSDSAVAKNYQNYLKALAREKIENVE